MANENWYALCLSILKNHDPDQAMSIIETGVKLPTSTIQNPERTKLMHEMRKEGHTWKQVGDYFGVSPDNAYRKVQRYLKGAT